MSRAYDWTRRPHQQCIMYNMGVRLSAEMQIEIATLKAELEAHKALEARPPRGNPAHGD